MDSIESTSKEESDSPRGDHSKPKGMKGSTSYHFGRTNRSNSVTRTLSNEAEDDLSPLSRQKKAGTFKIETDGPSDSLNSSSSPLDPLSFQNVGMDTG